MQILKPIISIAVGFGLSCLFCALLMFIAMIPSAIFRLLKLRPYAFVAIAVVNFSLMLKYSAINIVWIIASIILFFIILIKHSATIKLSKQPDKKLKDDFDKANSQEWAYLYAFAIFVPILLNLNHLSNHYFGTDQMNIFKFYWTIDYVVIRYTLLLSPFLLMCMAGNSAYTYGQNAVRDLAKEREQQAAEEKAEQRRIEELNPDRLGSDMLADTAVDLHETDINDNHEQPNVKKNDEAENILKNIMDNLN